MGTNNDVRIRVIECPESSHDNLFYTCQYKKKGFFQPWLEFLEFRNGELNDVLSRDPNSFGRFKNFTLEQCENYNREAYRKLYEFKAERKKNSYIILK